MLRSNQTVLWALLCMLGTSLCSGIASAQIYKWVDADGNVHYGDNPNASGQAVTAETIEIQESYRPSAGSAEDQAAMQTQQELDQRRAAAIERENKVRTDAEAEDQALRTAGMCAEMAERVAQLSSTQLNEEGRRVRYFATEDGKSVTVDRQREIIAEIKNEMKAARCPI